MQRAPHTVYGLAGVLALGFCLAAPAMGQDVAAEPPAQVEQAPDVEASQPVAPEPAAPAAETTPAPAQPTAPAVANASKTDEVIEDEELKAVHAQPPPSAPAAEPNGDVNVVLRSRAGVATAWDEPRKDVFESTTIALFEAHVRRSERLRFVVGVRARYLYATRQAATADASAARFELDAAPTAAYADATLADGLHLRLGYQSVRLGRFDMLEALDILSTYDLRSGPATMPEAGEIAQPAVRVDWDAASWLSFTGIVLPFFEPHVVNSFDGNYALSRSTQAQVDAAYARLFGNNNPEGLLRDALPRTGQGRLAEGALSAFAPIPIPSNPQGALRVTAHGPAGEIALTGGTALEHLPALRYSKTFVSLLNNMLGTVTTEQLANDTHPIDVGYDRFGVAAVDGSTALGDIQLGAEVAYSFGRTFLAAETQTVALKRNEAAVLPEQRDLLTGALRVEYLKGQTWAIALEASAGRVMTGPSESRRVFMFMQDGRWLLSSVAFVGFTPGDIGLTLELGGGLLNGPTYLVTPRVQERLFQGFFAEAGAYFLGGKSRPVGDPRVTLGGMYGDTDQVFVGLRWLP
ncbi:MAG: hypothetical protein ACHQ53_02120 [Polyangiales bacterium]